MPIGTAVAKEESETRRVQRVNRVKLKIAVSGGFGGGVLSRFKKAGVGSLGGTELTRVRNRRAVNCGAADCRPEGAWGSFPGKISSPHLFLCPVNFSLSLSWVEHLKPVTTS